MRVHIIGDIFIHSTGLGYNIEKRFMQDVKDKETKQVTRQEEKFDPEKHYVTLTGAINGLMNHYVQSITDDVQLELDELIKIMQDHKKFIESKLGGF
jgi:hypothetical protein